MADEYEVVYVAKRPRFVVESREVECGSASEPWRSWKAFYSLPAARAEADDMVISDPGSEWRVVDTEWKGES